MRSVLAFGLLLAGCGGSAPPSELPSAAVLPVPPRAPVVPARQAGTLRRAEVVSFVESGFGEFLSRVEVEPSLDSGRFRGWEIVALRPPGFWQGVDLRPGDVVTSVNGLPIERETEAWEAFQSLKLADELIVHYRRERAERGLVYKIVD